MVYVAGQFCCSAQVLAEVKKRWSEFDIAPTEGLEKSTHALISKARVTVSENLLFDALVVYSEDADACKGSLKDTISRMNQAKLDAEEILPLLWRCAQAALLSKPLP